jgi:hypothetical protein
MLMYPDDSVDGSRPMMAIGEAADIKWWYHFLTEECELRLGEDWTWAWYKDAWAVEFRDPQSQIMVLLRLRAT